MSNNSSSAGALVTSVQAATHASAVIASVGSSATTVVAISAGGLFAIALVGAGILYLALKDD